MPSTSPGSHAPPTTPTPFEQVLPGKPVAGYQSLTSFRYRHRRYVAYISGSQLSVLSSPNALIQAITVDDDLVSVASEPQTGRLAVATEDDTWVLEAVTEGWTRIWWEKVLQLRKGDPGDKTRCLSWGGDGELLVGGTRHLSLFSTVPSSRSSSPAVTASDGSEPVEERRALWSKDVSSPLRWAAFSPTANLIATCGARDRLVKIWRRLSFEEGLFDHTYLPHPGAVTHMQWRPLDEGFEERRGSGKSGRHDDDPEVLHTIANDGVLRVWRTGGIHDLDTLVLHTTVDLVAAIPQSPSLSVKSSAATPSAKSARYAFTIPSFHFTAAVKAAIGLQPQDAKLSHSLEHLKEVSSKEPDLIITLDGHGRMSAWGLQSIGHKRRPETPSGMSKQAFHIAHCEDLPVRFLEIESAAFEIWFEDAVLNVLSHGFEGEIKWWRSDTEAFFSPAAGGKERLSQQAVWSGLHEEITGVRATSGKNDGVFEMISADDESREVSRWTFDGPSRLRHTKNYTSRGDVVDAVELPSTAGVVSLEGEGQLISLRNSAHGVLAQQQTVKAGTKTQNGRIYTTRSLATSAPRFVVLCNTGSCAGRGCTFTIAEGGKSFENFVTFDVNPPQLGEKGVQLTAIRDAKEQDRSGIVSLTSNGLLLLYHVDLAGAGAEVEPVLVATFTSGVERAGTWVASNEFAALVSGDGLALTIMDLRDGYIEHQQRLTDPVQHLSAMLEQNLLAVGHETYVDVLAQGCYSEHSTWQHVRQISLVGTWLGIGGLAWFSNGQLAVAAGNGAFVSSEGLPLKELGVDLREALALDEDTKSVQVKELAGSLKTPFPVWHPRLLVYLVHCGRWSFATGLLTRLLEKVKFWSEGDHLDPLLGLPAEQAYGAHDLQNQQTFNQGLVDELCQQLDEKKLPQLSSADQAQLRRVLDAMLFCAEHVRGLDNYALRFLFSWKLAVLDTEASDAPVTNGDTPNGISTTTLAPEMHWREIAFAHQSTTQQPLLDILSLAYDNKISWRVARNLGLFAWLSDREALASIFESLAQSAYRASSPPDPINATLYFLALHKKSTLLGLWRIATWHKEQRATTNFLKRDFSVEANRTAAKKNAYALMGKRRFEYAAAFFLLAEDAASATSLMAGQCGDVMLAIAVARLYAGDGSPVLRKLVEDRLLPDAVKQGDRWQASWCHSILLEGQQAAEALVRPLEGVRGWEVDDPHTLALYRRLRKRESEWEWDAVLRGARLLRKMGLSLAAIELVRSWEFQDPSEVAREQRSLTNGNTAEEPASEPAAPPSMLDDFTSPPPAKPAEPPSMLDDFAPSEQKQPSSMLDDFSSPAPPPPQQDEKAARAAKAAELLKQMKAKKEGKTQEEAKKDGSGQEKRQPTQFKEPSADSLLDSFGF